MHQFREQGCLIFVCRFRSKVHRRALIGTNPATPARGLIAVAVGLLIAAARLPVISSLNEDVVSDGIPGIVNANEEE